MGLPTGDHGDLELNVFYGMPLTGECFSVSESCLLLTPVAGAHTSWATSIRQQHARLQQCRGCWERGIGR
jgi:hypothetical protein